MDQQTVITLVVVAGVFVALWLFRRPDIDAARARELVAKGARLIDVRTPGEFGAGHISGARNIPLDRLGGALGELHPKEKPIIVYCASGTRSAMARRRLREAGFPEVYNLGPMSAWQ